MSTRWYGAYGDDEYTGNAYREDPLVSRDNRDFEDDFYVDFDEGDDADFRQVFGFEEGSR